MDQENDNDDADDYDDSDSDDDDDDDDEEVDSHYAKICKSTHESSNSSAEDATKTFLSKGNEHDLADGINWILRRTVPVLDVLPYTYKRYEVILDNDRETMRVFEADTNNTIPNCSFVNAPLCRIFNSTNSTPNIENLLTVSFHQLSDCIQIYCHVLKEGKLYGQRIFKSDLFNIVASLFQHPEIDNHTKAEVNDNWHSVSDELYKKSVNMLKLSLEHVVILNLNEAIPLEIRPTKSGQGKRYGTYTAKLHQPTYRLMFCLIG